MHGTRPERRRIGSTERYQPVFAFRYNAVGVQQLAKTLGAWNMERLGNSILGDDAWRLGASLLAALLAAAVLLVLPGALEGDSPLSLGRGAQVVALGWAVAFLFAWVVAKSPLAAQTGWFAQFIRIGVVAAVATQPVLLLFVLFGSGISRVDLVVQLAAFVGLLFVTAWRLPVWIQVAVAAATLAAVLSMIDPRPAVTASKSQFIVTSYHDLKLHTHEVHPRLATASGAVHLLEDGRVLLVNAEGGAYLLTIDGARVTEQTELELNIPINRAEYIETQGPRPHYFRVVDVFVLERDEGTSLLTAHSYWDSSNRCYVLRLSRAPWESAADVPADAWRTVFESEPCVELPRNTNEHGGRMALLDDDTLLFSVGNHKLEAYDPETLMNSDYGQIHALDLNTGETELFSDGHRNVQGLWVAENGIWATEHGPYGGDELNLVEQGKDYGWPRASYGTDYTGKTLKLGELGVHAGFERPIYSWTPSIAISSLIQSASPQFPLWQDDLLIGSLWGKGNGVSIYRVRIREGRMVSSERIRIGSTIRDLLELPSGEFLLWDGKGTVSILEAASHVFASCAGCHATRSNVLGIGPTLHGVVGAPVARQTDYEYSDALRAFGGKWTESRLHAYLEDPAGYVPGTTMLHGGIKDEAERQEIIEYLKDLTD